MMRKLIEESGLSIKEFSEKYGIPYNTVRQWYNGARSAPDWLVNLLKAEQAYKPLVDNKIYYVNQNKTPNGYVYYRIFDNKEDYLKDIGFDLDVQDLTRKSIKGFTVEFRETLIESEYKPKIKSKNILPTS